MKGTAIVLIVIVLILAGVVGWGVSVYNGLVTEQEKVNAQWANVENQYQRRADLIPNLVNTVKGYATHEKSTLEEVTNARANATKVTITADQLNEATLRKFQAAQGELSQALGRLLAVSENYPDLKANQNFMELQTQLERTENRIAVERMRFNEIARDYNTRLRRFPANVVAGIGGFVPKPYFEAEAGANTAPKVEF